MSNVFRSYNVQFQARALVPNTSKDPDSLKGNRFSTVTLSDLILEEGMLVDASDLPKQILRPLMLLLCGLAEPNNGRVIMDGNPWIGLTPRAGQKGQATFRQNIVLRGLLSGLRNIGLETYFAQVLELYGDDSSLDRKLKGFDPVERSRVNYALLYHLTPDIFIMEEWFGSPNKMLLNSISELLEIKIRESRMTILGFKSNLNIEYTHKFKLKREAGMHLTLIACDS